MTRFAETVMLAHGWRRFLMLLVAGALAGLSVPPFFLLPVLYVTMPVWVWALDGAEQRRSWLGKLFGPAFAIGFAFGLGYFLVAFHWLGAAFFVDGGIMLVVMPFAILALAALIAFFWGLGSSLAHLFWSPGPWRIVTLTTFLTAAEWARGHFFSGFPFDLLGYALSGTDELMQLASVIGVYGLTFLVILLALSFGETVFHEVFAWISSLTGLLIRNFGDLYHAAADYLRAHTGKVLLAIILTIPASLWILRSRGEALGRPASQRKIAIVLAIFLGWLGAHRFYQGQVGWGLGMLVICWIFMPLAVVLGLIDAIRYLFMDDDTFATTQLS